MSVSRTALRGLAALSAKPAITAGVRSAAMQRATSALAPMFSATHARRLPTQAQQQLRAMGTSAIAQTKPDMFCFQCEQTEKGTGCTTVGVCGKTPPVAAVQDLLLECVKGLSQYAVLARGVGVVNPAADRIVLAALFSTVTNVNFDEARIIEYIRQTLVLRDQLRDAYQKACKAKGVTPVTPSASTPADIQVPNAASDVQALAKSKGVLARQAAMKASDDYMGLQEMSMYGLKGTCAYAEHALMLGQESEEVYKTLHETLAFLTRSDATVPELLGAALKVGALNLKVMELLDKGATTAYGHPEPTQVPRHPREGKAILVSGHDLRDLELILKQTEGKGINVYTHGEMLPAHSYPGLKKYKNLAGHYGGPWQLQKFEFAKFPGAIVMTTNCLIEPMKSYKGRIFTRTVVGWPGVTHITSDDFTPVINSALAAEGFTKEDVQSTKEQFYTVGFGRNAVLSVADKVIDAVKTGAVKHFFLIGGCDGSEGERNAYKELALASPKDSILLTLGCGKYRINSLNLGNIGPFPRVMDMGQCNDAFSAITVASALAKAFNTDVNGLPLSYAISWFEQKAVAVLLTMLHLGIRNIRLGPNLPGFCTPNMLKILTETYNLRPVNVKDIKGDMALMLQGK